ncbi:hypothetical protein Tco_0919433 [Tanacetum coccineum]
MISKWGPLRFFKAHADNSVPETEAAHTSGDITLPNGDSVAVVDTYEATIQSHVPMKKIETANSSPRLAEDVCIDITKQSVPKEDVNHVLASNFGHISDGMVTNDMLNGPCEKEKNDVSSCGPSGVGNFPGLIKKTHDRCHTFNKCVGGKLSFNMLDSAKQKGINNKKVKLSNTSNTALKTKKKIKSRGLVIGNSHLKSSSSNGSSCSNSSKATIRDDIGKKLGDSFNHHSSNGVQEVNIDGSS